MKSLKWDLSQLPYSIPDKLTVLVILCNRIIGLLEEKNNTWHTKNDTPEENAMVLVYARDSVVKNIKYVITHYSNGEFKYVDNAVISHWRYLDVPSED